MNCSYHPEREAVGKCTLCGKNVCTYCRTLFLGKTYCPQCLQVLADQDTAPGGGKSARPARRRAAAIFLILLSALTYLPIIITWDGSQAFYIALITVAIVSLTFQIYLLIKNTWIAWWGSTIAWLVNIVIVAVSFLHSIDPTGMVSVVAIMFFGAPAIILLLHGKVSNTALFVLTGTIIILTTFFLFLYGIQEPPWY